MNCYRLVTDYADHRSINGQLYPGRERLSPYPNDIWNEFRDMEFTEDGRFTERSRVGISKMTMLINPKTRKLPDVIGSFSVIVGDCPAFGPKLRAAVQSLDPDLCDFCEVDPIWDERHQRELRELGYSLTTIRKRIDCWDPERTKVGMRTSRDGSTY